jgi:hypothetical protein
MANKENTMEAEPHNGQSLEGTARYIEKETNLLDYLMVALKQISK